MSNSLWLFLGFWLAVAGFYYFGSINNDFSEVAAKISKSQRLDYQAYTPEEKK